MCYCRASDRFARLPAQRASFEQHAAAGDPARSFAMASATTHRTRGAKLLRAWRAQHKPDVTLNHQPWEARKPAHAALRLGCNGGGKNHTSVGATGSFRPRRIDQGRKF